MTGFKSKKTAALDEDGMYLVHHTAQEPVAFINAEQRTFEWAKPTSWHTPTVVNLPRIPLYTTPPQRTWVGLTQDEIDLLEELYAPPVHPDFVNDADHCLELIRHIEAKLKEKNT